MKRWSRAKKIALIEETNPTWEDLSQQFGSPVQLGYIPPQGFGDVEEQQIPRRSITPPSTKAALAGGPDCAPLDDKRD